MFVPIKALLGVITPPLELIRFAVVLVNTPPAGFATILYGLEVLHKFGMAEIVGIFGLNVEIVIVFTIGQFTYVGVTTTVYIIVLDEPTGVVGNTSTLDCVLIDPKRDVVGVHE